MDQDYLSAEGMATRLGVSPPTLKKWIKEGVITDDCYFKIGNLYRFDYEATRKALHAHSDASVDENQPGQITEQLPLQFGDDTNG